MHGARAPSTRSIPRPEGIQPDVNFWIRVYTEVTTNEGFLHDERNLSVIYDTLKFGAGSRRAIGSAWSTIAATGTSPRCAASSPRCPPKPRARRCRTTTSACSRCGDRTCSAVLLRDATQRIRFQLGQADRFKEGLIRSSSWETHIAETFANQGLPPELAVLPHVESSFNAAAYSKVGAAGLWQFMRSTGRRYMRIDDAVDERLDPYRSTEAAAQLLAYNYRVLGSWPLALTAYNHGAAGMRRAKESVGTDDFVKINRTYNSRTFRLRVAQLLPVVPRGAHHRREPGEIFRRSCERRPEQKFREVTMPAYVRLTTLERTLGLDREQLRALNPAWRPTIYNGTRLVPRGYRLRLPADTAERWTAELLTSRLPSNELYAGQITPRTHRVRKGESLAEHRAEIRAHAPRRLAEMNGLSTNAQLRAGRRLQSSRAVATRARCAGGVPATVAGGQRRRRPRTPRAASAPGDDFYVVRRGDSLQLIAARVRVPEAQLLRMNRSRIRTASTRASACASRVSRRPTVVAAASSEEAETKVAAIDAARGEAQREVAAVEVVREETTRPIGSGEPTRGRRARRPWWPWKPRPRRRWRRPWCRPRRARASRCRRARPRS